MAEHFYTTSKVSIEYFGTKMPKTSEKNFEDDVEAILGLGGWRTFASNAEAQADYDRKAALKVDSLVKFVQKTQPEEWAKVEGLYGARTRERFVKRLVDELEPHDDRGGVVNVLRHGIRMAPGHIFACASSSPRPRKTRMPGGATAPIASR